MTPPKRRGISPIACTRGQLAKAGLVAARASRNHGERVEFLDALGVTESLDLPLPVSPKAERYVYSAKRRPVKA